MAKGRRVAAAKVHSDFGEGGVLTAQQALDAGAADKIATLDEVVARLAAGYKTLGGSERAHDAAEVRFRARLAGIEVK